MSRKKGRSSASSERAAVVVRAGGWTAEPVRVKRLARTGARHHGPGRRPRPGGPRPHAGHRIGRYRDVLAHPKEHLCRGRVPDEHRTVEPRGGAPRPGRAEDLREASALIDAEIERRVRGYGSDQPLTWTAWAIYADILLDQSEADTDPARARE
ncbi:hypothetical protein [Actinomadura terrae]|uniref:hypothetical protein n=1 Tax=Actinomadura terrae TaxID=604353 RepID=UPI001FA6BA5F|nr:hypothetical protein [Actinomadura terrae]